LLEAWQSRLPGLVGDFYSLPTVELLHELVVQQQQQQQQQQGEEGRAVLLQRQQYEGEEGRADTIIWNWNYTAACLMD
jgi:hypothetical protein